MAGWVAARGESGKPCAQSTIAGGAVSCSSLLLDVMMTRKCHTTFNVQGCRVIWIAGTQNPADLFTKTVSTFRAYVALLDECPRGVPSRCGREHEPQHAQTVPS